MAKVFFRILCGLGIVSFAIIILAIFRIDPYTLNEKELLFFVFLFFIFLFSFFAALETIVFRTFLRRDFIFKIIFRQSFFIAAFLSSLLILKIMGAFSILGALLLAIFFGLLELYFKR